MLQKEIPQPIVKRMKRALFILAVMLATLVAILIIAYVIWQGVIYPWLIRSSYQKLHCFEFEGKRHCYQYLQ